MYNVKTDLTQRAHLVFDGSRVDARVTVIKVIPVRQYESIASFQYLRVSNEYIYNSFIQLNTDKIIQHACNNILNGQTLLQSIVLKDSGC